VTSLEACADDFLFLCCMAQRIRKVSHTVPPPLFLSDELRTELCARMWGDRALFSNMSQGCADFDALSTC
jgi:hypothetical protein